MLHYIGIVDGSGDVWGVRFPDLIGCHGGGNTVSEAIADAASAAREWAEHRASKKLEMPKPRSAAELLSSEEFSPADGEVPVLIPVLIDQGRPVKANLSIDAGLLEAIDKAAAMRGLTRSAFIASAAREKIVQEA